MNICVIVPNWNGIDFLSECLDSLSHQTSPHHVIVVDNGSKDGSKELVEKNYPEVELLAFNDNAGFAGGVNRGIIPSLKMNDIEYIALLNNDAVASPDWLEKLSETISSDPNIGIVTSKILHFGDSKIDSTGDFYSTWGFAFPRGRDEADHGQYDDESKRLVFAGSGGASMYSSAMLREIGLFDEAFFAYFEDVDISFRAQLAGWIVKYTPYAVVHHHIGGTSSKMNADAQVLQTSTQDELIPVNRFARYHTVKNFYYLYTKNMPGLLFWKYILRFWLSVAMMFISDAKRGLLRENMKATMQAILHYPQMLKSRFIIQSSRKVTVKYVDSLLYKGLPPLQRLRFSRFLKH